MKWEMARNSLFAVLLRSPWWVSIGIAVAAGLVARMVLPDAYAAYGMFSGMPFLVIGVIAAWKQLRAPSAAQVANTLQAVGAMSWGQFSNAIEAAFRRDGFNVSRLGGNQADFEMVKAGRTALLSCKRWKAARIGIEPLRDLHAAREAREAQEAIYVALGEITDTARAFATEKKIRLMQASELAQLLRGAVGGKKLAK